MQRSDVIREVLDGPGVELVETHGSRVFLHPQDVYKVKKPVRFPFLDYMTLEKRRTACLQELRVNRRASPHTYLGVRPIRKRPDGGFELGEAAIDDDGLPSADDATVVDWVVHMRRLPDADRADVRLSEGTLEQPEARRIAAYLVELHATLPQVAEEQGHKSIEALSANVAENLDSLEPYARQILGTDAAMQLRACHLEALARITPLLQQRLRQARVVDGHGDFRLDHVYLDDAGQVTLLDAIEFDPAFRIADVTADIAFLAMDLCSRGRTDLAEGFIASYAHESGDHDLYALIDFYMTYWALVRAKVDAARFEQLEAELADETLEHCSRRLFLASHLAEGEGRGRAIIAITGLIASGKSRVARALGYTLAAPVLSSDRIRKQLAHVAPTDDLSTEPYKGAYSASATRRVYRELVRRAEVIARSGRPVVLDASFQDTIAREEVRALAASVGAPYLFIQCTAPRAEILSRLERRASRKQDSDARAPLLDYFESRYPPWEPQDAEHHATVDTSLSHDTVDQQVLQHARRLRRASSRPQPRSSLGRDPDTLRQR